LQIAGMGEALGIQFYLFCFTDLFGVLRSKLVPASAVRSIATGGAGFAGFAAWMDMSPADGDVLCMPDPKSFTQLPWKPEVAWLACDPHHGVNSRHNGEEIDQAPRNVLRAQMAKLQAQGYELKTGVELEFFLLDPNDTAQLSDLTDTAQKPCYDQVNYEFCCRALPHSPRGRRPRADTSHAIAMSMRSLTFRAELNATRNPRLTRAYGLHLDRVVLCCLCGTQAALMKRYDFIAEMISAMDKLGWGP
jgi:hypothetical protein